jgi:WD40 repeat protein/serine/threonine protein kinase/tetratricopeptide (TPR) repeat protein
MIDSPSERNPVEALAEEFLARFRRGERPSLSEYTSKHPELSAEIRDLFPALVMLEDVRPAHGADPSGADPPAAASPPLERLGDYRILREVGRGGMGIVYEAEQESLGRYVALKVLPRHALLDPRQLQRFQREARAAARLHHTNLVPVFGVGEKDGLHYYVMQFIHGQGLDQVLAVLRQLRRHAPAVPTGQSSEGELAYGHSQARASGMSRVADFASVAAMANSLLSGVFAPPAREPLRSATMKQAAGEPDDDSPSFSLAFGCQDTGRYPSEGVTPTSRPESASSSEVHLPGEPGQEALSDSGRPYWRSVARIGIQVAEALAYAHSQGVLHRDIKPSNLLLDTQGVVWVTDFGLAKAPDSDDLTQTGDIVGTLRYMAPERFQGRADARSDVYALGLTLYELLTLRPAFDECERHQLLHHMLSSTPPPPRKLNPAVPRDLETIVLKAMAANPAHRYPNAGEMAADLRRFMDDKPIQARPVSDLEKLWRWCRRNPTPAVLTGLLLLSLLLGILGVTWKWREAEQRRAEAEDEKGKASRAEREKSMQRDEAVDARNVAQRGLASVMLDRGVALAEQGDVGRGLLWMLEAFRATPADDAGLARVIRTNLGAWRPYSHTLRQFIERPRPVVRCAFGPDGRRFFTQADDGAVHEWDTETGRLIRTVVQESRPGTFALSPHGRRLLLGFSVRPGQASQARLYDAATSRPLGSPLSHPDEVYCAAFTPDGNRLATACRDGMVRLWDAATGQLLRAGFPHDGLIIQELAISPDGQTLATATTARNNPLSPGAAYLWSLNDGKQLGPPWSHRGGGVDSVAFSPDGKQVVTGSWDHTARIWDVATRQPVGPPLAHTGPVWVVRFTPDGQEILTGGEYGVTLWGRLPRVHMLAKPPVHSAHVHDLAICPDGKTLVTVHRDAASRGAIHMCQLPRGFSRPAVSARGTSSGAVGIVAQSLTWFRRHLASFNPDATRLVSGGKDGYVRLFDTATGQPECLGSMPFRHPWKAVDVTAFSPGGRFFATSSRDRTAISDVRIWESATGRPSGQAIPFMNHIAAMAFSPDEKILATGGYDCTVRFWDTSTGKPLGPPLLQGDIVLSLAFSPDGKMLAVGHADDYSGAYGVILWDVASRKQVGQALPGVFLPFRFSPDGRRLVTAVGTTLRLWDTATGLPIGSPSSESSALTCLAFQRDGQTLLTAATDGTLRLREADSLKPIGAPMSNSQQVNVAIFSPDPEGRLILAGYADGCAQLWDRATQKPLGPPVLQARAIVAAAFTLDGRTYLTAAEDGSIRRWSVPQPIAGEPDRLALRLQAATGMEMRDGQILVQLDFKEWQLRRRQLTEQEGSAPRVPPGTPDDRAYHDARARDAQQLGNTFAARWHLDRLIAAQEGDRDAPRWQAYARRGDLHTAAGKFDLAKADYARALALGSPKLLLGWYRHRIADRLAGEQWQAAQWYLDRAVAAAPDEWTLYADRSLVHEKQGRRRESEADLEMAAERGADSNLLLHLADVYAGRGCWDKAAAVLDKASARDPLSIVARYHRALACLKLGDRDGYRRGCVQLLAAVGPAPSVGAANFVAWVNALGPEAVGDYTRLLALAELAVDKAPPAAKHSALNTQGALLYRAGRFREAVQRLEQGLQADKGQSTVHDWLFLAMAHQRLGDKTKARQFLEKAAHSKPKETASPWDILEQALLRQEAEALIRNRADDSN